MSIRRVVAMETVTLTDLTDAIISGTEPDVKTEGMLWIDGDNILKQWNGVSWDKVELDVSSLDPDLSETITTILGKVGSIADDGVLDFEDRKVINEEVALIIGDYPSTSLISYTALPDYNDFDSNPRGSFGRVRETTRSVIGDTKARSLPGYVALASAFQKLGDLLIKTRPVRMWDITTLNKDVIITLSDYGITSDDLRTGLLNYYMAELTLSEYNNKTAVEVSKEYTDENIKDTVKEMVHMYAYSDSVAEPPHEGIPWSYEPLSPVEDKYIWMRTRVIYKNGDESTSEPYLSSFDITATLGDLDQKTNNPAFSPKGLEGGGVEVEFGGGRNLLRNTSGNWTELVRPEGNYFYEAGTDYQVEVGETYTFSIIVEKVSDDSVPINLHLGLGDTAGRYIWDFSAWRKNSIPFGEKISLTYTIKESDVDGGDRTYFAWRLRNERLETTIRFKEVKLEKGTTATPYTPAPEDGTQELDIVSSVGGRNFLLDSANLTTKGGAANGITRKINGDGYLEITAIEGNSNYVSDLGLTSSARIINASFNKGERATFSIEIKSEDSTDVPDFYFGPGMGYYRLQGKVGKEWSTLYISRDWSTTSWSPHFGFSNRKGTFVFRNAKLEKGTTATSWTPAPEDIPYDTLIDGVYRTKAEFPSDESYRLPSLPNSNYVYTVGDFEPPLITRWKSPVWKSVNTMQDDMVIMGNNIDTTMEGTRQMIYQLRDGVYDDGSEYSLTEYHNIVDTVAGHDRIIGGEDGSLAEIVMRDDYFSQRIGTPINRLTYPNNAINTGLGTSSNSHTVTVSPGLAIDKGLTLQFKTSHYSSSKPIEYLIKLTTENEDTSSWITSVSKSEHNIQRLTPSVTGVPKTLEITLVGDNSTKFTLRDVQLTEEQPDDLFPLPFHDSWSDGNFSRILQLEDRIRDEVVFGGRVVSAIETNLDGVEIKGKTISFDGDLVEMTNLNVRNLKGDTAEFLRIALEEGIGDSVTDGNKTQVTPGFVNTSRYGNDGQLGGLVSYGPYGVSYYAVSKGVLGDRYAGLRSLIPTDADWGTYIPDIGLYSSGDSMVSLGYMKDDGMVYHNFRLDGKNDTIDSWADVDMHAYQLKTGRVRLDSWGISLLDDNGKDNGRIAVVDTTSNIRNMIIGSSGGGNLTLSARKGTTGTYPVYLRLSSTTEQTEFYKDVNMNNNRIYNQSDERLKENITPTRQNSLELIQKFNFYDYDFIDGGKDRLGIIAQELQKIAPEIVDEGEDGYLFYDSNRLFMTFGHATQQFYREYEQEIKKLKEEIRQLKEKL